jgi:hypothetical protein
MTKTCGDCRFYAKETEHCKLKGIGWKFATDTPCSGFTPRKPITNGDKIRQGGDDELIDFADGIRCRMCHYCVYSKDKSCVDKAGNCWEGVRAWLNAPVESEVEE